MFFKVINKLSGAVKIKAANFMLESISTLVNLLHRIGFTHHAESEKTGCLWFCPSGKPQLTHHNNLAAWFSSQANQRHASNVR